MRNPEYLHKNGIGHVLYQCYFNSDKCDVMKINDIVENSTTGEELARELNKVQSKHIWTVDRETDSKVRLISKPDSLGNYMYFTCDK